MLSQALYYKHLLSRYSPVTPLHFDNKRQERWLAKRDFWENCRRHLRSKLVEVSTFSSISFSLQNPSHYSSLKYTRNNHKTFDVVYHSNFAEHMSRILHHTDPTICQAFMNFDQGSESPTVEGPSLALPRTVACTASVTEPLVEKEFCGGRLQSEYTDACAKVLCLPTNQLFGSFCHFAQYWHPGEFEVDNEKEFIEACRNSVCNIYRTAVRALTLSSVP